MSTPEQTVIEQMEAVNLTGLQAAELIIDGKLHRFKPGWEKSKKRGWYVLFEFWTDNRERLISGSFGWFQGAENNSFDVSVNATVKARLSEQEQQRLIAEHTAKKALVEKQVLAEKNAAAKKAKTTFEKLPDSGASAYLDRKKVKAWGIRFSRGVVVVPVCDLDGEIHGLQFIQSNGEKKFLTGTDKKGHFHLIGKVSDDKPILFAEGYATAASLHQATRYPVVVAFDAGNLLPVASAFRVAYPYATLVICGDEDASSILNTGRMKAEESARLVGGIAAFPEQLSEQVVKVDWNDVYVALGFESVLAQLLAIIGDFAAPNSPSPTAVSTTAVSSPVDDSLTADFAAPDSSPHGVGSFASFEIEIEAAASDLKKIIAITRSVQLAQLHPAEIEVLLKMAAKQVGVSVSSLKTDQKPAVSGNGGAGVVSAQIFDEDFADELNRKHAIVPMGGRVFVMNQEFDPALKRPMYTFSGKQDFILRYMNRFASKFGDDIGTSWLLHPKRRQYEGIVFSPSCDVDGYFNLFQGFGVVPEQGSCQLFQDFVYVVICNRDMELFEYLWCWLAHLFQKPDELPGTAFVLRGKEGIGKNTFVEAIGKLVGMAHFIQLSSIQQVIGRFSGHLTDKLLVFANEAIWGGDKQAEGTLKHIISDEISSVEYKGKDIFAVRNYKRLVAASNEDWVIPRGVTDRRWVVCDVSECHKEDQQYFDAIHKELQNGGYEALMYEFMNHDISAFNPRRIPKELKAAGWELKLRSGGSILQWWFSMLDNGYMKEEKGFQVDEMNYFWLGIERKPVVHQLYLNWCDKHKVSHPETDAVMGRRLKEFGVTDSRPRSKGHVPHYNFQSLEDSRLALGSILGIPADYWRTNETE